MSARQERLRAFSQNMGTKVLNDFTGLDLLECQSQGWKVLPEVFKAIRG